MEESNGNASNLLAFGEHNNGLSPLIMMPSMDSCSQPNGTSGSSSLFFSLPNSTHQDHLSRPNKGSSVFAQHSININGMMSAGYHFVENNNANEDGSSSLKAKIMSHPYYQRLLAAYVNCQKIGAPSEVVAKLEEACASVTAAGIHVSNSVGQNPALDQFMEAYCEMLVKYEQELSKPFKEAMLFLSSIESQFKSLTVSSIDYGCPMIRNDEEYVDANNNETTTLIDPQAEDRELKGQLLRKYSGYLGSLKQEFMKKRKKGKLPKEARQQLLDWWSRHYKWPYPSEAQKVALAESTGLDQKQINNWFINQRKRHWKPSEDMQFVVMDHPSSSYHVPHPHSYNYMDNVNVLGNPFAMDISPALL